MHRLRSSLPRIIAILVLLCVSSSPRLAAAQGTGPDAARPLAEQGFELFQQKRWIDALDRFRRAEDAYHALPHMIYIARSLVEVGSWVEASTTYGRILGEKLAEGAPEAFRQAQTDAAKEKAALDARIPRLEPFPIGVDRTHIRLEIDGRPVTGWPSTPSILVDPGHRILGAHAANRPSIQQTVLALEGTTTPVELSFGPPQPTRPVAPPPADDGGSFAPAVVAFSVGGAALIVGAVTGGLSLAKVSDIEANCSPDLQCPASLQGDADDATVLGNASTAMFVIGGVGVATGVVLLLTRPTASANQAGLDVHVGFGRAVVTARF